MRPSNVIQCVTYVIMATLVFSPIFADCTAPPAWFPHQSIKEPDPTIQPLNNCEFHQWAWGEFLFLTRTEDDHLFFETLPTDKDLLTPGQAPIPFAEVKRTKILVLTPRVNKEDSPKKLGDITQAESQGVALVDHQAMDHSAGRAVYYLINVNKKYFDFVRTNKLYDPQVLESASPTLNFDEGSVVLKSSWRIVPSDDNADGFYKTKAKVASLTTKDGKVVVDETQLRDETVALVGIHVVGVVRGHPEFLWATFEHNKNAPDLPVGTDPQSRDPVNNMDFTFYRAKTAAKDCNQSNAGSLKLVDEKAQLLSPVLDVFRQFPQGGGNDTNRSNISTLNDSVHKQLEPGSVWRNYNLIGTVWTSGNLQPNQRITLGDSIGSINLSNTTMETTSQAMSNCFTCHNTLERRMQGQVLPGLNVNISHILRDNFFQSAEALLRVKAKKGKLAAPADKSKQ